MTSSFLPSLSGTSSACRIAIGERVIAVEASEAGDRHAVAAILRGFPAAPVGAAADMTCLVVNGSHSADGLWELHVDGVRTHQAATLEHALLALEWQVVQACLARTANRFHLHGAALADPTGRLTVLVLGESGAGKTTLTLALIARGFKPFADDVVLLDPETMVPERFPRAFHIDDTTRRLVSPLFLSLGDSAGASSWEHTGLPDGFCLPLTWAETPVPVGAIVLPLSHGAPEPVFERQSVADAAIKLLSYSTTLEHDPALALKSVARLTAVAPCFTLRGGPLATTADAVSRLVSRVAADASTIR